jgi:two-component system sensor histidine kinase KdpD
MVDHSLRLKSVESFPIEVESMVRTVSAIRREFLTNPPSLAPALRMTIRESWLRCAPIVDIARNQSPVVISSDAELRDLYLSNAPFLQAATPVVERLASLLAKEGYIIGLADSKGRLLQVKGEKNTLHKVERLGLTPGGDWSEPVAGTNGIGTALAVGHAVRVVGPEHLCDGWQDISCITVPIRDPWDGTISGALDISGDYHLLQPFFTGILTAAALEIRENLKNLYAPEPSQKKSSLALVPKLFGGYSAIWRVSPDKEQPDVLQLQLDAQKHRANVAERLALAVGAIGTNLDLESTLACVVEQAAHIFGLDGAAICLINDKTRAATIRNWSRVPAHSSELQEALSDIMHFSDAIYTLRENGEPMVIDNLHTNPLLPTKTLEACGIVSLALLPLMGSDGISGMILLPRQAPYQWQPDDLRLGLVLAIQAVTAIENAQLFNNIQKHQQRVEALNAVNSLLHSIYDPTNQLELIIEQIAKILKLDGGLILLYQTPSVDLLPDAQFGLRSSDLGALAQTVLQNADTGKSILICQQAQFHTQGFEMLESMGLCDVMIAPLTAGCNSLGFLLIGNYQHADLADDDLTLLTSIAQQIGLSIRNTQLLHSAAEAQALREADDLKNRFLMMVSHDLRSPLTAIRTSVECLLDQGAEHSENTQEYMLQNIASQAGRLGRLVDSLLDLSRIEAGALVLDRDWTELNVLIFDTLAKFERLNALRRIEADLESDLPLVYIDPERMVQVLWNLLENAHKYSPQDMPITVEAFSIERQVFIRVTDRGPGIPPEEREKIFQYFYRLNRDYQKHTPGSGLGLAICEGIIEAHGGQIWVDNRAGGGSIFSVSLPPSLTNSSQDLVSKATGLTSPLPE